MQLGLSVYYKMSIISCNLFLSYFPLIFGKCSFQKCPAIELIFSFVSNDLYNNHDYYINTYINNIDSI